jgi:hypothetical protein
MKIKEIAMNAEAKSIPAEYAFPREDSHGFAGTLRSNYDLGWRANARLWVAACEAIETTFKVDESERGIIRNFLRSRYGRMLADDLSFRMSADPDEVGVKDAIARTHWVAHWLKWFREVATITRRGEWEE